LLGGSSLNISIYLSYIGTLEWKSSFNYILTLANRWAASELSLSNFYTTSSFLTIIAKTGAKEPSRDSKPFKKAAAVF
jgi:hypothetical protein